MSLCTKHVNIIENRIPTNFFIILGNIFARITIFKNIRYKKYY